MGRKLDALKNPDLTPEERLELIRQSKNLTGRQLEGLASGGSRAIRAAQHHRKIGAPTEVTIQEGDTLA